MVRFSRDKRFFLRVSFHEFLEAAANLCALARKHEPCARVQVLTCEDITTYNYSTVTFLSDEIEEALKQRKRYALEEFDEDGWNRSYDIQMSICDPKRFVIRLSIDRSAEPGRLMFYYSDVGPAIEAGLTSFKRPSLLFSIGDGYSKPSRFNLMLGQKITGISLLR